MILRNTGPALLVLLLTSCTGTVSEPGGIDPGVLPPATSAIASASGARRMTTRELDNALRDLLGDDTNAASRMLVADQFLPFDNDYTIQMASEALITSLEIMATDVADRAMADAARRDALVPCTPSGPGDADCFRAFVEDFVPKALRRPLEDGEADRYMVLQAFSTEDIAEVDNDFYTGVGLVVRAVLQDPEFLYRIEVGTPRRDDQNVMALNGHEIATRLSFLLWGTVPDETLLGEAASGALDTPAGRRTAAERMLADPRARETLQQFHTMWLGYKVLPHGAELVNAFNMETNALIDRVVLDEPQSYLNMFTFGETYVDDFLADHYGLPRPDGGEGWVPYGDSGRAGLLSHGSILASFAKFADTSPTQRGILIRTRLMCQDVPPPPATVDADEPPGDPDALCKIDRYEEHRRSPGCASCHDGLDPIGFGLENYNMAGQFREHDDGQPDCIISGEGALPDDAGTFNGPAELGQRLVEQGYIEDCVMQQFYTFAIGRQVDAIEQAAVTELTETFRTQEHDLQTLIVEYVASERFAHRREERL